MKCRVFNISQYEVNPKTGEDLHFNEENIKNCISHKSIKQYGYLKNVYRFKRISGKALKVWKNCSTLSIKMVLNLIICESFGGDDASYHEFREFMVCRFEITG